jgi:hypothetical protein
MQAFGANQVSGRQTKVGVMETFIPVRRGSEEAVKTSGNRGG